MEGRLKKRVQSKPKGGREPSAQTLEEWLRIIRPDMEKTRLGPRMPKRKDQDLQ